MLNKDSLVGQKAERVVRHIALTQRLARFYLREYNPLEDPGGISHDFSAFKDLRRDARSFLHGASLVSL